VARTGGVLEAVAGEGSVLLDRTSSRSHVLNASAALVWDAIDGTRTADEIVEHVAGRTGLARDEVSADVRELLARLAARDLVVAVPRPDEPGRPAGRDVDPGIAGTDPGAVMDHRLATAGAAEVVRVTLAGAHVSIRSDDPQAARLLEVATGSLPRAPSVEAVVEVLDAGGGDGDERRFHVVVDGVLAARSPTAAAAADAALVHLNLLAVRRTEGRLLLHAGAVERGGGVVVVAGPSGRGKSTLTAALVRSGFGYLTDELVAVDPVSGAVVPYPKGLDLAEGSRRLLGLAPGEGSAPAGPEVRVAPDTLGRLSDGGRVALVVLLADPDDGPGPVGGGVVGAEEALVPLDPVEALVELLPNVFDETFGLPGALQHLADLVSSVPVLALPRLPLATAVAAVEQAAAEALRGI
jgi:hypothetical protein